MPRLTQGRIGLALWGGLVLGLTAIFVFSWVQLGRIGEDAGTADVEPYRQLLLSTSIIAGVLIVLLLVVAAQRTAAPLRHLARTLRAGQAPVAEDFATATSDVRDVALLIGRLMQEERGISSVVETQQTRLASILDNLSVGVIVLAEDERVLLANAAAAQLFEFTQRVDETTTLIGLARDYEAGAAGIGHGNGGNHARRRTHSHNAACRVTLYGGARAAGFAGGV